MSIIKGQIKVHDQGTTATDTILHPETEASLVSGLSTVATSGSYNDLSDKPTIPTVNDATITIKMNNASKGTFTTNAGTAKTIDLGTVITSLPAASTTTAGITKVGASGGAAAYSHTHTKSQITDFPTDLVTYYGTITPSNLAMFGADGSVIGDSGLSVDSIQSKITSTNKLSASLVSGLATVATSGSYNDLSDKPTIPSGITGAGVYYGVCSTAGATAAKTVTLSRGDGFALATGVTVFIKFTAANTASNPTLNVNGTGAKALMQYGSTAMSTNSQTTGWRNNSIVALTYDGTNWMRTHWENSVIYYTSIYCTTSASNAAKTGNISSGSGYQLTAGKNFQVMMYQSNTKAGALTFNIASTGAKPIYINGQPSSATNYTLPAGEYLVYYDGTNYYFETDGTIRAKKVIADNSPTVLTLSGDGDVITGNDFANYYTNPNPAHVIYHSGQRQYYYLQTISTGTNYNVYYVCPSSSGSAATRDTIEITPTGYWSLWA